LYRWKPSSKLPNQIDRLLRAKKVETGVGTQSRESDHQGAAGGPVNRKKGRKSAPKSPAATSRVETMLDPAESRKQTLVAEITEAEGILTADDDGHFSYEQLSRLHQLLQRLDVDRFGTAYFFEFLEQNFRV